MNLNPEKMAQEALKEEACAEQFKYAYPEIADGSDQPHLRVLMGHGRIEVGNAKHDGLPALWFGKDGQGLGFERDRFEKAKPNETLLVITFENIQGLEAIEHAVARVREDMTGEALSSAPAQPVREPMSREQMKALMTANGYALATAQERADFINGFRNAERHHGICKE